MRIMSLKYCNLNSQSSADFLLESSKTFCLWFLKPGTSASFKLPIYLTGTRQMDLGQVKFSLKSIEF